MTATNEDDILHPAVLEELEKRIADLRADVEGSRQFAARAMGDLEKAIARADMCERMAEEYERVLATFYDANGANDPDPAPRLREAALRQRVFVQKDET